jgi:hypothetical protein
VSRAAALIDVAIASSAFLLRCASITQLSAAGCCGPCSLRIQLPSRHPDRFCACDQQPVALDHHQHVLAWLWFAALSPAGRCCTAKPAWQHACSNDSAASTQQARSAAHAGWKSQRRTAGLMVGAPPADWTGGPRMLACLAPFAQPSCNALLLVSCRQCSPMQQRLRQAPVSAAAKPGASDRPVKPAYNKYRCDGSAITRAHPPRIVQHAVADLSEQCCCFAAQEPGRHRAQLPAAVAGGHGPWRRGPGMHDLLFLEQHASQQQARQLCSPSCCSVWRLTWSFSHDLTPRRGCHTSLNPAQPLHRHWHTRGACTEPQDRCWNLGNAETCRR